MREIALVSAFALIASAESNLIEIYKNASFIHQNFTTKKANLAEICPISSSLRISTWPRRASS